MLLQLSCQQHRPCSLTADSSGSGPGSNRQPADDRLALLGGQVTASIVTSGRRVLGYPGPGGYTVSLVMLVAVSVAAVVVAASVPLTPRKAGP